MNENQDRKQGFSCTAWTENKSVLELVLPQSHVVFSLTFELSCSTVITSHTLTSWTIISATLSAIDKVQNGLVGDTEAPGF